MKIRHWTVGPFAENTYLLLHRHKALLIDPGFSRADEFEAFRQQLEEEKAELLAVVLTHSHVDHVLGLDRVRRVYDVPVLLSGEDRWLWDNFASQAAMFGLLADSFDFEPDPLPAGEWSAGPFTFDVRYTPGHAPDHVVLCSEEEGMVIAGDTLFRDGIGRTDLYRGSFEVLCRSIREKLYTLPDTCTVWPGHGPATTIGREKRSNPFVTA